jgi:hypothetical protein
MWLAQSIQSAQPTAHDTNCDAPGFRPGWLALMSRSSVLTLVKRRSTWAITSKTSPTNPNDSFWSTIVHLGQNPTQKPLTPCWPINVSRNFCRVLQIVPRHFKFSQYKSCVFCWGTHFSCWVALLVGSAWWKVQVNACRHYSREPRDSASWHPICTKTTEKKAIRPLWKW